MVATTSCRRLHLCFLETGYAPAYGERALMAPERGHVRRALDFILSRQEPYLAIVADGGWNFVMANGAARGSSACFRSLPR